MIYICRCRVEMSDPGKRRGRGGDGDGGRDRDGGRGYGGRGRSRYSLFIDRQIDRQIVMMKVEAMAAEEEAGIVHRQQYRELYKCNIIYHRVDRLIYHKRYIHR